MQRLFELNKDMLGQDLAPLADLLKRERRDRGATLATIGGNGELSSVDSGVLLAGPAYPFVVMEY